MHPIDIAEARRLAEESLPDSLLVLPGSDKECEFGYFFALCGRAFSESGEPGDRLAGPSGVLVDRNSGVVHAVPAVFGTAYWFELYRRGLHLPTTLVVSKVWDRRRAAEALHSLHMTYVRPETAHGVTWRIPKAYRFKDFLQAFDRLPARFENQRFYDRLREIEAIERSRDLVISFEKTEPPAANV